MTASTFERLKKIIVEQLGVDEADIKPEASFVDDLNADSLDLVELGTQVGNQPVLAGDGLVQRLDRQLLVGKADLQVFERVAHASHRRALRNRRRHGASSIQPSGCHEFCTARTTRSGCGIMIVTRPSSLVRPVIPSGEPLGLAG